MKKVLSLFLSLVMLMSITAGLDLTAYAAATSGKCGANAKWSYNTSTKTLTISGSGAMTDYKFAVGDADYEPSHSKPLPPWFSYENKIKTVKVGKGITYISEAVFQYATALTSVSLPSGLKKIGDTAFFGCTALKSIKLPSTVTTIGIGAFAQCESLTSVTFPSSLKVIEDNAFYDTKISSIVIPYGVTTIGSDAFGCVNLKSVYLPDTVKSLGDDNPFSTCELDSSRKINIYFYGTKAQWNKIKPSSYFNSYVLTYNYKAKYSKISLSTTSTVYNGKVKTPAVKVLTPQGKAVDKKYYTVTYAAGRKNTGKYKVTVKFQNGYTGTKNLYFTIKPAAPVLTSVKTSSDHTIKLNWKKLGGAVTGFQICWARDKEFKDVISYKYIGGKDTVTYTGKNFTKGRRYYVRVRAYKKADGKNIYGVWSAGKSIVSK